MILAGHEAIDLSPYKQKLRQDEEYNEVFRFDPRRDFPDVIEAVKDDFFKHGLVLEVICRTANRDARRKRASDSYRALVLSQPEHRAWQSHVKGRLVEYMFESDTDYAENVVNYLPWQALSQHPLARTARRFEGAVGKALTAWQEHQESIAAAGTYSDFNYTAALNQV